MASALGALFLFLFTGLRVAADPVWTWDQLAYVGCVAEARGQSTEEIHRSAYGELELVAPPEVVERLTRGRAEHGGEKQYRQTLRDSPGAFEAQLGFYRGRWLFLRLLDLVNRTGLPVLEAAFWISGLAGALLAGLLFLWIAEHVSILSALVLTLLGMRVSGAYEVAANGSPDTLATLLLVAGAYALVHRRNPWLGGSILLAALLTRVDHVALVIPLLAVPFCFAGDGEGQRPWVPAALFASLSVAVILFCTVGQGTYDWWTVHCHTFERYMAFPADETPPVDLAKGVLFSLRSLPKFAGWPGLVFLALALGGTWWSLRQSVGGLVRGLCAAALVGTLAHFALFPVLWPRLMGPYWLLSWMGVASLLGSPGSRRGSPAAK